MFMTLWLVQAELELKEVLAEGKEGTRLSLAWLLLEGEELPEQSAAGTKDNLAAAALGVSEQLAALDCNQRLLREDSATTAVLAFLVRAVEAAAVLARQGSVLGQERPMEGTGSILETSLGLRLEKTDFLLEEAEPHRATTAVNVA